MKSIILATLLITAITASENFCQQIAGSHKVLYSEYINNSPNGKILSNYSGSVIVTSVENVDFYDISIDANFWKCSSSNETAYNCWQVAHKVFKGTCKSENEFVMLNALGIFDKYTQAWSWTYGAENGPESLTIYPNFEVSSQFNVIYSKHFDHGPYGKELLEYYGSAVLTSVRNGEKFDITVEAEWESCSSTNKTAGDCSLDDQKTFQGYKDEHKFIMLNAIGEETSSEGMKWVNLEFVGPETLEIAPIDDNCSCQYEEIEGEFTQKICSGFYKGEPCYRARHEDCSCPQFY